MACEKTDVYSVVWLSTRRSSRFSRKTRVKWSIWNWTCVKITDRGCFAFFKYSHDCLPVCVVLASCSSLLSVFSMFCGFLSPMSNANANDRDCELDAQWLIEWSNEQAAHRKKQEKHGKYKRRTKKLILPVDKRKSVCVCVRASVNTVRRKRNREADEEEERERERWLDDFCLLLLMFLPFGKCMIAQFILSISSFICFGQVQNGSRNRCSLFSSFQRGKSICVWKHFAKSHRYLKSKVNTQRGGERDRD